MIHHEVRLSQTESAKMVNAPSSSGGPAAASANADSSAVSADAAGASGNRAHAEVVRNAPRESGRNSFTEGDAVAGRSKCKCLMQKCLLC